MEKTQQLSERITKLLLHEIQDGEFSEMDSLPPEVDLADRFQVSRNIIRECLARLEREGWVIRKHGVGTLINKHVVHVETRMDLNFELSQTLEMNGKRAETDLVRFRTEPAGAAVAAQLKISEGDEVLRVSRLIKADGKPVIYCIDYLPMVLVTDCDFCQADFEPPIFHFLDKFCSHVTVETNLAEVRALPVTEEVAEALEVPLTCALLFLGEVGYDLRSRPVLYSEEYFMDRVIRHMIVRKKI
ncbi:GntR family transcriptional regulator [uncultured Oscillibacter sp.]|uniref:GntR family transcriptional regulator n=1 Tax=uncultured Oscillibacter sp. TaxID=876091 RepID=UPI00261C9C4C|nr:GntR family transcriptional regulator [uncultured Oscillibacter sp.]